jgi:peptidoglycan pentaglycine glycine transferase (the first glycine)
MPVLSSQEWDRFLERFPNVHILQTSRWGQLKSEFGWEILRIVEGGSGAQILFRRSLFITLAYIPKGPVGDNLDQLLATINQECRKRKSTILIIEPDLWESKENQTLQSVLKLNDIKGYRFGKQSTQPRRTLVVDLEQTEDQILSAMKQKTRYNIRLAKKKGVQVKLSSDLASFNKLMQLTGNRDNFAVHLDRYYEAAFRLFEPLGKCALLMAIFDNQPLAGIMVFQHGNRAWYFYGASSDQYREMMPSYLLQWQAIKWAKNQGCHTYDLWGIPDEDETVLEANFSSNNQDLWGVYRFKRGFGGVVKRAVAPIEYEYIPALSKLFRYLRSKRVTNG